jgi:polyhydroxybutyrate depolymerase
MSEDFERRPRARVARGALAAALAVACLGAGAGAPAAAAASAASATSPAFAAPSLPEFGQVPSARVRHLGIDGLDRSYLVQPVRNATGRVPVVVLLHGGTQTAEDIWRETSLPTLGAREGFIVVAPQAAGKQWNDARGATLSGKPPSTADDVRFLKAVIAQVVAQDRGDASAVFMVGASNGGFMTMRFACDAGDTLRAAASAISTLPEALAQSCKSPRQLPWLAINGTDDPLIPFAGQPEGVVRHGQAQPALRSADATFRFWADRAGCAAPLVRKPLTDPAQDERQRWAEAVTRSGCTGGLASQQVVLHGSGHVVPGLRVRSKLLEKIIGPGAPEIDGGTLIWAHFKATLMK